MRVEFNRTGAERKALVTALSSVIGENAKYLKAPTMAYEVGKFTVTKDGAVEYDEFDFPSGIDQILQDLERSGIEPVKEQTTELQTEATEQTGEPEAEQPVGADGDNITVQMPREFFTDETLLNLKKIIESKGNLMRHAFGAEELPIEATEERVSFPWFNEADADSVKAYTHFISAICHMAKEQKRITAKEKQIESEKYAFRCFLLRLGFSGAEYKAERKILLKNLAGPAAFPTQAAADEFSAKQKAKKEVKA